MKGTYRSYRFQIIAIPTFTTNEIGQVVVVETVWRLRIQDSQSTIFYDSATADPVVQFASFDAALTDALLRINQAIAAGETAPTFDPLGGFI